MSEIVQLTLPIFGLMALGWTATRTRLTPPAALDALTAFAFRFALPALVFRLIGSQPLADSVNPVFYGGYLLAGTVVFGLAFALSRILDGRIAATTTAAAGARATAATVSNLGFLGPPLMLAFFGERGAGPLAMAILAEIMVLLSVGAMIMSTARNGTGTGIGSLVLRGTVLNPVVAAILLGTALAATGAALPAPADRFFGLLGGAAGPTALFALGGALALQRVDRGTVASAAAISAAKLVLYPALAWWVLAHLLRVDAFWVQTGVLMAALPTAGNVYVVAQRYSADADRVSAAILLSTVASVATVPLVAGLALG
jgi:predicted permease